MAVGLALAGAWEGKAARAGLETFAAAGLGNDWVDAGSFTGQASIAWTYAHACGIPTVYTNDPAIVLQTGSSTNKGWLRSATITGGCARVSGAFKQVLSDPVDCVVLVNGIEIANYRSSGAEGSVEEEAFEAYDRASRTPFTNDFTLMVSNRLASGGRVAIDNLAWEPFRLFVRVDRTGTNLAYAGQEFDAAAEVFAVGEGVTGGWSIEPAFAGELSDANSPQITLVPAEDDVGQTFTVAYAATDPEGTGRVCQAGFQMEVLEAPNPRFVDFEGAAFGYDANGVATNLHGMDWTFFNVQTSDSTDRKIGATSARFRHSSSAAPAIMESAGYYEGVGAISVHGAYYGSNRVVRFEIQTRGEGEADWSTNGDFSVWGCDDIASSVFFFEVQRSEPVRVRLITTGNFGEIADLDDLRIREYGDVPPRLVWSGATNAPVGWETALDFTLLNAEGMVRTWDCALVPPNAHAAFETLPDKNLRLRISPADTNDWGDYVVAVTARFDAVVAGATSVAIRVVSPPAFDLAPVATNVAVREVVDVWVTNVVLHGTNRSDWKTEWMAEPTFSNLHSVSNKSRFRIADGTTEADVGAHVLTAVLTDSGTGVRATNAATIWVASGGGNLTNEVYAIVSFSPTQLVVGGKSGRVFRAFGTTNLAATNGFWLGPEITNASGADQALDVTHAPDPRQFFYGVKVRAAP